MGALFLKLFNMSIAAGWLVLVVILLRLLLKKVPKAIIVVLWALVGLRLAFPFSIESAFSLIPSAETIPVNEIYSSNPSVADNRNNYRIDSGFETIDRVVNPIILDTNSAALRWNTELFAYIWLTGIAIMVIYTLISYWRIRQKVREATLLQGNIWICDRIATPFILGIIRPRIYLPSSMHKVDMEYVLAHEKVHLKRRDHWWKPLGFALLTLHWFNPMIWVAYVLLCKDIELACDERVIKNMGADCKKPYAEALINCSVSRKSLAACPLAFGEVGVKERIKKVLHYKKPAFWVVMVAVVVCIVVAVCFLTDPKRHEALQITNTQYQITNTQYKGESVVYTWGVSSSLILDVDSIPQFFVSEDMHLGTNDWPDEMAFSQGWYDAGELRPFDLDESDFEEVLMGAIWEEGYSTASLLDGNVKTWAAHDTVRNRVYYLLVQKNGDVYIVHRDCSTTNDIRWIFKMKEVSPNGEAKIVEIADTVVLGPSPVMNYDPMPVTLPKITAAYILELLDLENRTGWQAGAKQGTMGYFTFSVNDSYSINYCNLEGIFSDFETDTSLQLSDAQKETVNAIISQYLYYSQYLY